MVSLVSINHIILRGNSVARDLQGLPAENLRKDSFGKEIVNP